MEEDFKSNGLSYEELLRNVFNCGEGKDPFKIASADHYHYNSADGRLHPVTFCGIWMALKLLRSQYEEAKEGDIIGNIIDQLVKEPTHSTMIRVYPKVCQLVDKKMEETFPSLMTLKYEPHSNE